MDTSALSDWATEHETDVEVGADQLLGLEEGRGLEQANEVYEGDFNERGKRHGKGSQWP